MSSFRKWEGPPPDPPTSQIRSHIKDSIEIAGGPSWRKFLHICELEWCTFMKLFIKLSETELIDFLLFCYHSALGYTYNPPKIFIFTFLSNIDIILCNALGTYCVNFQQKSHQTKSCEMYKKFKLPILAKIQRIIKNLNSWNIEVFVIKLRFFNKNQYFS